MEMKRALVTVTFQIEKLAQTSLQRLIPIVNPRAPSVVVQ